MQTMPVAPPPAGAPYRFTADEYFTMAAAGALDPNVRTELVGGQVVLMAVPDWPHIQMKNRVHEELLRALGASSRGAWQVVDQDPVRFTPNDVRFPDVAIVRAALGRVPEPSDVVLAIEVAVSTLATDTEAKRLEYARAGIPHYWVVDVRAAQVRTYDQPQDGDYRSALTLGVDEVMAVPVEGASPIAVAALFT
jgi:Uma2 family endonuclease